MSMWSQLLMQESISMSTLLLSAFHDYSLGLIGLIFFFVSGVSVSLLINNMISSQPVHSSVEVIWTVLPMVFLVFLVIPSLRILYFLEETKPYINLKVIGNQWYWSYEMEDLFLVYDSYMLVDTKQGEYRLLEVDHRTVLPVNKNIRGLITAADVLHCWALPSSGLKADAVPGRLNQVSFSFLRSSLNYGQCSEICGANHSFMPIVVESVSPEKYLMW
uniref:Cytochrome c oxidase subunit 2 n=1 Tax=Celleporella hyalina TaxID=60593 RepID=I6Q0D8_9BILA|nr:cytochrome c oxidase subunit II [Celleporella hyalina]AFJ53893.1 cytochrome c oxidase subunit 2 [Celleporella hyalina]